MTDMERIAEMSQLRTLMITMMSEQEDYIRDLDAISAKLNEELQTAAPDEIDETRKKIEEFKVTRTSLIKAKDDILAGIATRLEILTDLSLGVDRDEVIDDIIIEEITN